MLLFGSMCFQTEFFHHVMIDPCARLRCAIYITVWTSRVEYSSCKYGEQLWILNNFHQFSYSYTEVWRPQIGIWRGEALMSTQINGTIWFLFHPIFQLRHQHPFGPSVFATSIHIICSLCQWHSKQDKDRWSWQSTNKIPWQVTSGQKLLMFGDPYQTTRLMGINELSWQLLGSYNIHASQNFWNSPCNFVLESLLTQTVLIKTACP